MIIGHQAVAAAPPHLISDQQTLGAQQDELVWKNKNKIMQIRHQKLDFVPVKQCVGGLRRW